MKRLYSAGGYLMLVVLLCAMSVGRAAAQAAITLPEVLAVNVNTVVSGTDNTQYIFRCLVDFGFPTNGPVNLPGLVPASPVAVYIDPIDPNNPEGGTPPPASSHQFSMIRDPTGRFSGNAVGYIAYVSGSQMAGGSGGFPGGRQHRWTIVAKNSSNGGTFMDGVGASPKPAAPFNILPSGQIEFVPVDANYQFDKRPIPGQLGNGLRVNPEDTTTPNDGGSSHVYTFRVRVRTTGALPVEPFLNRGFYEWRDYRPQYDAINPFTSRWNSGVVLVLVDPQGTQHYCPMEIDPDAPGQGGGTNSPLYGTTYQIDPVTLGEGGGLVIPTVVANAGNPLIWDINGGVGVFYRYRMMPTQYNFAAFGGPVLPDILPAQFVGSPFQNFVTPEVIGRPFANDYVAFAGPDFAQGGQGPTPFYTDTANRSGNWKYYFAASTDFRPKTAGNPTNSTYPSDFPGRNPSAYITTIESDKQAPGSAATAFIHPQVDPMLSDGSWTDDLPENNPLQPYTAYGGTSLNAHRSRATTRTKVRFQVRVTRKDETPLPANGVQVWIDGTPHTMTYLSGSTFKTTGKVYFYDTTFPNGLEGQHWTYFIVDDGNHKAIWPRRPSDANDPSQVDPQYPDPQTSNIPRAFSPLTAKSNPVDFGTLTVGRNYIDEPYINHRAVLSSPSVNPVSGAEASPYTYEIVYTDLDGDEPMDANVVIDGAAHRMTPVDGTPVQQGRRYRFVLTSLVATPDRKHNYYFQFRDNWATNQPTRREFGEWTTLPNGDDSGVPSSVINGPIITGNNPPELTDPQFFFSDPAQTPATFYDFAIRYKDADNDAPQNVKLFISADDGVSYDGGTALVKAENSNNYVSGVQYHLPIRIHLPVGNRYRYKFTASDGTVHPGQVDPQNTTLVHAGSGFDAITTGTAHTLTALDNSGKLFSDALGTYKWYTSNPDGTPALSSLFVWTGTGPNLRQLQFTVDPTITFRYSVDGDKGQVLTNVPADLPVRASYFYVETRGPTVHPNHVPVLTAPGTDPTDDFKTLTPLFGSASSSFTYTITYTDPDNQAPSYVNLVVDTNRTFAMVMDPATPTPIDYTRGVKYNVSVTGGTLGNGTHKFHFEASDGADLARFPLPTDNPAELTGPNVADIGNLQNALIQPAPKGKSTDNYTFTVTYKNAQGLAPTFPIEVRIKPTGGGTQTAIQLNPIDPIGPTEYTNGVRYQVQLPGSVAPLLPGSYDVTFGFVGQPAGTTALTEIVNGRPVLSSPTASPNPASQAGDIVFAVNYTDVNGDPPTRAGNSTIKLYIDGTEYTAVAPTTVGTDFKAGVIYKWAIPAKNLTIGAHKYYFSAQDDLEDANPLFVPAIPGSDFTINAAQVPQLLEPGGNAGNNNGTLTPLSGAKSQAYTYTVNYRHLDGVPPTTINVVIDPGTANARTVALTSTNPNPTAADFSSATGVQYTVTLNDLASGPHTYKFVATDRLAPLAGHSVELPVPPGAPYNGPTVNFVPTLSVGTVFIFGTATPPTVTAQNALNPPVKGNILSKFVFQVKYSDQDGAPPAGGYVRVVINGTQILTLKPKPGDPLNYTTGVIYSTDVDSPNGVTLTPGQKSFHFEASDGLDPVTYPSPSGDITGLTVANIPVLGPINTTGDDGTLSPRTGPLSTTFTYKVLYKNADNTPPAYVRVIIDGTAFDMVKAPGANSNYAAGVVYQYQNRFPSGTSHTYRFTSEDTVSPGVIAQYPVDGSAINGPTINVPVFITPTFTPNPGVIGQPMTISSQLQTNTPLGTAIGIQLIRPDGSGINDQAQTDPATGNFTYTFTPSQTGDWKVKLSYGGSANIYDPVTTEFPFSVSGFKLTESAGGLDMLASPLIPVTPDPSITFSPTLPGTTTPVSITVLNLIKWVPDGTGGGRYLFLNRDAGFPGITGGQSYWAKPDQSVDINPRGRLWDQTQPYSIPLQTGWNMIGSVYLQDINWSAVQVRANGTTVNIANAGNLVRPIAWGYNKTTGAYDPITTTNGVLQTGHGYWVKALQPCDLLLNIPGARSATIGRDILEESTSLQVAVRTGNRSETQNFVPVKAADPTRMALMEKPPYVQDYVTVNFIPAEKVELPAASRAAAAGQNVVAFEVLTDHKNADITVQFPNAGTMGRKTNVTVIDIANGTSRSVANSSGITFNSGDNTQPRRFALIIKPVTAADRLVISNVVSDGSNRASGVVHFNYSISGQANVKAQIIGATGQTVRSLDSRAVTRGANALVWDGKDSRGISVPSGSYNLKLSATDDMGNAANVVFPVIITR
jgi:hypothetical protein